MHTVEVDGVPVFWQDAPGPLTAGLMFGCGARDETFLTIGVTHLVERLVMSTLPRVHPEQNASVTLSTTDFRTTGRADQVASFLLDVCQAISAAPVDRLEQEAGDLEAEGGFAVHPTGAALLTRRFGARDVGLELYVGPGPRNITPDAVREHLARFFVTENAALWLTGPPPDGLRLPLPRGIRPRRNEPVPVAQDGPQWSNELVPAPGLLLTGNRDAAWSIAMAILEGRVTAAARHRRGLGYQVFGAVIHIGQTSRQYLLGADGGPGQAAEITRILWEQALRLAVEGPTDEELARDKAGFAEAYTDPRWAAEEAAGRARASLFDLPRGTPGSRLAEVEAVTRQDVMRCLDRALATALIAVPMGVAVTLPGVAEGGCPRCPMLPYGERFPMKLLVRLIARELRPAALYLTGDGLGRLDPDGQFHETRFVDVIGVDVEGPDRVVYAASGCVFPVIGNAYRDGDVLVEAIDGGVEPGLRYASNGRPVPPPRVAGARGRRGRGWTRLLNVLGAIGFGLATAALYLDWRAGDGPLWWVVLGGLVTLWCLWDARPGRRRRPRRPRRSPQRN